MTTPLMLGAVVGDIAGSIFEQQNDKREDIALFESGSRFTDDTVMTLASADKHLYGGRYEDVYQQWGRRYPDAGYGGTFIRWLATHDPTPYNSWGNGSAMRVSPIGWLKETLEETLAEAEASAAVSHSHPEGIRGAKAIAGAVFLARNGAGKNGIRVFLEAMIGYDLSRKLDDIRPDYSFDVSCQKSVPEACTAFLESDSVEDAIRKAISLGGDSDTIACIAGAIAHAHFQEIPEWMRQACQDILPRELSIIQSEFIERYVIPNTY